MEKLFSRNKDWEQLNCSIASSRGSSLRIGQHDPESQVFFTVNRSGTRRVRDNPHRQRSQYPQQQTTFHNDYSPESFQIYWCVVVARRPEGSWNTFGQINYTCCSFTTSLSGVISISDLKSLLRHRCKSKHTGQFLARHWACVTGWKVWTFWPCFVSAC